LSFKPQATKDDLDPSVSPTISKLYPETMELKYHLNESHDFETSLAEQVTAHSLVVENLTCIAGSSETHEPPRHILQQLRLIKNAEAEKRLA